MKVFTEEIKKQLEKYPLYSQDGKRKEAVAVVKLFLPQGAWTWCVMEANLETEELYGIVVGGYGEAEYGYFSLQELESVRTKLGLGIERDTAFEPTQLKDIEDDAVKQFLSRLYDD